MGEASTIGWTDNTLNCWHGCDKVSAGCKHCYAEVSTPVRVKVARGLKLWGPGADRDETRSWLSDLRKWGRAVVRTANGGPLRVFAQSLSDTFEDRRDLDPFRARFFAAMTEWHSRSLTFQLLTKRPENVLRMVPPSWLATWPAHVQIGATIEDQENAERRIPHLLAIPARVRFLSVEPQIGPADLRRWFGVACRVPTPPHLLGSHDCRTCVNPEHESRGIEWVIQGGESGSKARPFDLAWARSMRDQCRAAGVPYFLKQLGARPGTFVGAYFERPETEIRDSHGADESEWPADLRGCRAFPVTHG